MDVEGLCRGAALVDGVGLAAEEEGSARERLAGDRRPSRTTGTRQGAGEASGEEEEIVAAMEETGEALVEPHEEEEQDTVL